MKKIIVPVDFSKHSEYALETAAQLAKKINAEVLVVHMLEISETILTKGSSELQNEGIFFLKLAEKKFEEFLDKEYLRDINVTPVVKHFKVFKELNDVAKENDADLIVMGSHGSSGVKEIFIGSNTEKVVRHSNIPVFVVKHKPEKTDINTVVFACDFSEKAIDAYKNVKKMFKLFDAQLFLLYVNQPNERFLSQTEMEERVTYFLNKADGNLENLNDVHYTADYTVEKGIINFSNKVKTDLIAVATHGRKGIAHFFEGSVSEDLANHSNIPVMTFKV